MHLIPQSGTEMNMDAKLAVSLCSPYSVQDINPLVCRRCNPYSGCFFSSLGDLSGTTPRDVCLLGDSESSQAGSEGQPVLTSRAGKERLYNTIYIFSKIKNSS